MSIYNKIALNWWILFLVPNVDLFQIDPAIIYTSWLVFYMDWKKF